MVIVNGQVIGTLILLVVAGVATLLIAKRSGDKFRLGVVRCKRCEHVGKTGGRIGVFQGVRSVCANCGGDDWTVHR